MNYGQQQAVMVLAGQRLGFTSTYADMATKVLIGDPVHVMHNAAIEREATDIHNRVRKSPEVMAQANKHCVDLIAEYNLH